MIWLDFKGAIETFSACILISPTSPRCYVLRGYSYYKNNNLDLAIADYDKAVERASQDPGIYQSRAGLLTLRGDNLETKKEGSGKADLDKALADYTMAITLNPKRIQSYIARATYFRTIGDIDSAIKDYEKITEIEPTVIEHYRTRAEFYRTLARPELAIADYTKAIQIEPKNAKLYYERAGMYLERADRKSAAADYRKALEIDPNYTNAREALKNFEPQP